jgi:hypothetical protein
VQTGEVRKLLSQSTVNYRVAFSPDGRNVAVGRHDRVVVQSPLDHGDQRVFSSLDGPAMGVAYSPDGTLLATTDYVGKLRIFEAASGELLAHWSLHRAPGAELAFSPNGRWLASTGDDGRILIVDLEHQARYRQHSAVLAAGWNDDAAAWLRLGRLAVLVGAWPAARDALDRASALGAEVPPLLRARAQWAAGSSAAAATTLESSPRGVSARTVAIWRAALDQEQED